MRSSLPKRYKVLFADAKWRTIRREMLRLHTQAARHPPEPLFGLAK